MRYGIFCFHKLAANCRAFYIKFYLNIMEIQQNIDCTVSCISVTLGKYKWMIRNCSLTEISVIYRTSTSIHTASIKQYTVREAWYVVKRVATNNYQASQQSQMTSDGSTIEVSDRYAVRSSDLSFMDVRLPTTPTNARYRLECYKEHVHWDANQ